MPVLTLDLNWEQQNTAGETRTPFTLRWQQFSTAGETQYLCLNWFQCGGPHYACGLSPTLESITCTGESEWQYSDCVLQTFDITAGVKIAKTDEPLLPITGEAHTHDLIATLEPLTIDAVRTFFDSELHLEPLTCEASKNTLDAELEPLTCYAESVYQNSQIVFEPIALEAFSYGIIADLETLTADGTTITRPPGTVDDTLEHLTATGDTHQTFDAQFNHSLESLEINASSLTGHAAIALPDLEEISLSAKSLTGTLSLANLIFLRARVYATAGEKISISLRPLQAEGSSLTGHAATSEETDLEQITCTGKSFTGSTAESNAHLEELSLQAWQATHINEYAHIGYLKSSGVSYGSSTIIAETEPLDCVSSSIAGRVGRVNVELELIKLNALAGSKADIELEAVDLIANSATGGISYLDECDIEPIECSATSRVQGVSKLFAELEILELESEGELGTISALSDGELSELILQAEGFTGTISKASVLLPHIELSEKVSSNTVSKALIELPALQIHVSRSVLQDYNATALQMNTETNAVSIFTQYPYHSLGLSKKGYIAATDSGIFILDGETDNGLPIDAFIRSGFFDLAGMEGVENSLVKRCTNVYVGYRTDGQLEIVLKTDGEAHPTRYVFSQRESGLTKQRLKMEKGIKSRYWQYELRNIEGADFNLDQVEFLFEMLSRKVG